MMPQWWLVPRALHKKCWGDLQMQRQGVGSFSYQTGALQGRRRMQIAVNTLVFSIVAVLFFALGIFILFAHAGPVVTTSPGGQTATASAGQALVFKLVFFVILMFPLIERVWSYFKIEKKVI